MLSSEISLAPGLDVVSGVVILISSIEAKRQSIYQELTCSTVFNFYLGTKLRRTLSNLTQESALFRYLHATRVKL